MLNLIIIMIGGLVVCCYLLTPSNNVNCSKFNDGLTVCGKRDGITLVAITLTDSPYFLSLNMIL